MRPGGSHPRGCSDTHSVVCKKDTLEFINRMSKRQIVITHGLKDAQRITSLFNDLELGFASV